MSSQPKRPFFVPEVVQTSAMDCGPAALASLLAGCGRPVQYQRLREACQTDIDGTSIDTMETIACQLGLDAEQIMLPSDYVFSKVAPAYPCIAVVELAGGLTHFIVVWNVKLGWVQVMDPAIGRTWVSKDRFVEFLYRHTMSVPADAWREYAASDDLQDVLHERLIGLGLSEDAAAAARHDALADPTWRGIARLDAAARTCHRLYRHRAIGRAKAAEILDASAAVLADPEFPDFPEFPEHLFQVRADPDDPDCLLLSGAIMLRVNDGVPPAVETAYTPLLERAKGRTRPSLGEQLGYLVRQASLQRDWTWLALSALGVGLLTFLEALAFRYLLDTRVTTDLVGFSMLAALVTAPLLATVLLEASGLSVARTLGRHIDLRLKRLFLEKLPRIRDSFFASRLLTDLAERGHAVTQLRTLAHLVRRAMILLSRIAVVVAGLVWLAPEHALLIVSMGVIALAAPWLVLPLLTERELRTRTHLAALSRFYLDTLRGSETIWAHGAEGAMQSEYERLLTTWWRAAFDFLKPAVVVETLQSLTLLSLAGWLVWTSLGGGRSPGSMLLLAYWALVTPLIGRELNHVLRQLPIMRNVAGRVIELLDVEEEALAEDEASEPAAASAPVRHASLEFDSVTVTKSGVPILHGIDLAIGPGEQVAIVGLSGSGKSSLIGTILGWHTLTSGSLSIDGKRATDAVIARLRQHTVWVDGELYLWNRTALENVFYGNEGGDAQGYALTGALRDAEFTDDLMKMPDGLATCVGENGSRLSGGEGQRLRLARAFMRGGARLVLLDEPFGGMSRAQRERMLASARRRWPTTLIFVSHDIAATYAFERVLVMKGGGLVEDGSPAELSADPQSEYTRLLRDEQTLQARINDPRRWRKARLEDGHLETAVR